MISCTKRNSDGWPRILRLSMLVMLLGCFSLFAAAQTKTVTGTVVDTTNEPLIGASVLVKNNSKLGVTTNVNGDFTIANVPENAVLVVSYVGYFTQEVSVAGKNNVTITLKDNSETLDEVVVVGYGTQKKSDVTGAMSSVTGETLNARPVNNAFEALQGKAAGVDITTNERPGTTPSITIRGTRSLSATNAPLYVVDGVPLMSSSAIETLNPRDIESIDVLKDASATAIYGSRGANGVIIVTTKQGKSGQFALNYSGSVTWSKIVDKSPSMSAADFITFRRWAAYNFDPTEYAHPNSPTKENDMKLFDSALDGQTSRDNVMRGWAGGSWDPSKVLDTDWTDYVTQTGFSQEHTISASGGSDRMNAYASFGYLKNEGTQKGQWYERYTAKVTTNITPVKWMSFNASFNGTYSKRDYGMSTLGGRSGSVPDAIYGVAKQIYNMAPAYDEAGNVIINPGGETATYTIMDEWNRTTQKNEIYRILGNFSATLDLGEIFAPLKGLKYKIAFGPDFEYWREGSYITGLSSHKINADGSPGKSYARRQDRRDFSYTIDNMITFNRTFAEKHRVDVTLLQTASAWNTESSSMAANQIQKDSYLWNAFGKIDLTDTNYGASMSSGLTERQLESYMVRVNYGFNDRYLLTVSGRWDGASQLAEGHKWDFFPSAALAWRLSQEEFLNSAAWLSNLKLRLGVGTTGNAGVSPYQTKGAVSSFYLPFNNMDNYLAYATNEPYYTANQVAMANPDLGWEKTTQWNLGIDFGFLNNRISGGIDLYKSNTNDLLMAMSIPTLTGFPSTYANVGKTKNKGIELTINAIPVMLPNSFTWETNLNAAWQKDEIVELAYGKNDMVDNAWFIGESIAVFYGYENDGIWQESDAAEMAKWNENGYNFSAGNVRPKDQNGDYKMDSDDRVVIGNRNPRWTLGWSNTFTYKGFELSCSMVGRLGYKFNTGGYAMTAHANEFQHDYWTPDNTGSIYQKPILGQATSGSGDAFSSLVGYQDGGFIRMRNISLGYNFDRKLLQHWGGMTHLKVYAQAVNPFDIYQAVDGFDGDTGRTYFNRSWVVGLQIGF